MHGMSRQRPRTLSGISRPHLSNSSVRTDRVRTARKQACKKWTLTILRLKFPVPVKEFPVLQNIFPVNLRREFAAAQRFRATKLASEGSESQNSLLISLLAGNWRWRLVRI